MIIKSKIYILRYAQNDLLVEVFQQQFLTTIHWYWQIIKYIYDIKTKKLNVMKTRIILLISVAFVVSIMSVLQTRYMISKQNQSVLEKLIDSKELREFTFYYHTHDGEPAIHKRIYVTTSQEENVLSHYLIKNQEFNTDCAPYYDMCDSISIATLDTLSIGHNYPCKMLQLQWKEKIIWRKN